MSMCVALRIITDRVDKQDLLHSISQPFSNMDLALSRERSRNGQRERAIPMKRFVAVDTVYKVRQSLVLISNTGAPFSSRSYFVTL